MVPAVLALFSSFPHPQGETVRRGMTPNPCGECSIVLNAGVQIGGGAGENAVRHGATLVRRKDGSFIGGPTFSPGMLSVFSKDGSFRSAFGKFGAGPGEFRFSSTIVMALGPNDSLAVANDRNGRIEVFGPALRYVRSIPFPYDVTSMAFLSSGRLIVSANYRTPDRIGFPLHMIDATGKAVRSFGDTDQRVDPGQPESAMRWIAPVSGSQIWTAELKSYAVREYNASGTLTRQITRQPPWFITQPRPGFKWPVQRTSTILGIYQDSNVLWVISHTPNLDAKPLEPDPSTIVRQRERDPSSLIAPSPEAMRKAIDTVVEAYDLHTLERLAELRLAGSFRPSNGFLLKFGENAEGDVVVSTYTVSLHRKR